MARIIDASVALKCVIEEEGSAAARRLIELEEVAAPELLFIECANALAMKARRGLISPEAARLAMQAIESFPIRAIAGRSASLTAQAIALELGQTAYDCLYLAVAIQELAPLVTADQAFARAAGAHPLYARWVIALET